MSENKDKIERGLRHTFLMEHNEGPCIRLELKHIVQKGPNGHVKTYNIGTAQEFTDSFTEGMADTILTDAEMDAGGNGGLQRYQLLSYHANDSERPLSRVAFKVRDPSGEGELDDSESEPANERGMLAQQMRHNEALMRTQVTSTNNILQIQQRMLEKVQAEKEALELDRYRNLGVMERMMSDAHNRHLNEQQAEYDMIMKKQITDKLGMLLPAVVNKLAGANVLPQPEGTSPKDMILKQLSDSIRKTPGKLEKIMGSGIFSMEELTAIASLIDSTETPEGQAS